MQINFDAICRDEYPKFAHPLDAGAGDAVPTAERNLMATMLLQYEGFRCENAVKDARTLLVRAYRTIDREDEGVDFVNEEAAEARAGKVVGKFEEAVTSAISGEAAKSLRVLGRLTTKDTSAAPPSPSSRTP